MTRVQVAFSTDTVFLPPTLVAMTSVLERCSADVRVYLLGDSLTNASRDKAADICHRYKGTEFIYHDTCEMLKDAPSLGRLTRTAMGRMLLPQIANGRVLYLDSDTIVYSDIAPLFSTNMRERSLGAVRDFATLDTFRKNHSRGLRKYKEQVNLMEPFDIYDYFNSAVLLLDCDTLSSELKDEMAGTLNEEATRFLDQDMINRIFKGQVTFLDPEWNIPWGRIDRAEKVMRAHSSNNQYRKIAAAKIVHFPGTKKPWHKSDIFRMMRYGRAITQYRRNVKEMDLQFW